MNLMIRYTLLLCIVLLCASPVAAANSSLVASRSSFPVVFSNYMAADGLSDNNVLCGLRDHYGFMWLGTSNGLNCFDGIQNTIYRNMTEGKSGIQSNTITALHEHGDDIWFGGSFGLYVFNRQTKRFTSFNKRTKYGVNISATVQDIVGSQDGRIWIGTLGQGLFIYDPHTDELTQDSRHGDFISDILAVSDSPVFVATLQGKVLLYGQDGSFMMEHHIPNYHSDKNNISLELIGFRLYIGCESGLYTILRGSGEVVRLDNISLSIHSLLRYGGQLLMGTDEGIYLCDPTAGGDLKSPIRFDNPDDKVGGLTDARVNAMTWDSDSTLWVMTQMGGVCYMPQRDSDVQLSRFSGSQDAHGKMINAVCEMPDGRLWVGHDHGIGIYNPHTQLIDDYPSTLQEVCVLMADGNDLWIGTRRQGIIVLNTVTGQQRHYQYSSDKSYTVPSNEITALLRTTDSTIYVGTSWGLCRYERATENFLWYFEIGSATRITSLTEDKDHCVWAATSSNGLFKQWEHGSTFRNFTRQNANSISTVFCDQAGQVWVAYNGTGLAYYLPESESFQSFGTDIPDIQDQQIYFIVEDHQRNLWMGVENGIICISKTPGTRHLRGPSDMLRQLKPRNSACITHNGELFAGQFNQLAHFHPERIKIKQKQAPVYITSITLPFRNNEELMMSSPSLTLHYSDNSFTLHFSQPLFNSSGSYRRLEYHMEGIDAAWAKGTKNAEATYMNVPPGDYVFLLREAGSTDESTYARLNITVLPPWYRTNVAYVIYFLLLVAAIVWLQRRYNNKLKKRYARRLQTYQAEQEKANFESKIRFFINIVHEIRTPLTLISLPLEAIEQEGSGEGALKNHIGAMRRNINYLLGITNQLLDFQKAEHGKMQLTLSTCDVGQLLDNVYQQFTDAMELQGKHIQLQLPSEPVVSTIDADKVQKVMMNLIGNATKFARNEIIVRLETIQGVSPAGGDSQSPTLRISVIDDGPGVPPEERDKIFDLYYQIGNERAAAGDLQSPTLGTGLGLTYAKMLAQSHDGDLTYSDAVGGGSNFQLTLPIRKKVKAESLEAAAGSSQSVGGDLQSPERKPLASGISAVGDSSVVGDLQSPTPTFRILLVEDNEELLQMTSDALRNHFRIVKAHDGIEALDLLKYNEVDVIVSDVMMPHMDGNELCRRLKEDINYSHIPVILLTAKTSVEAKVEGMESGADIYLEKPFSIKQLHLQITNLLRMRQIYYERRRNIDSPAVGDSQSTTTGGEALNSLQQYGLNQQDMHFLEKLQQMVADNMRDEEFSIDMLAEQMNMSRSSFYRKVKALTDMTPVDYLKMRRIEQAAILIKQGYRINEVAERVGFTSSSYFAKCFKAHFAVLPKDYLAKLNDQNSTARPNGTLAQARTPNS